MFSVALTAILLSGCRDERREQGTGDGPLLELLPASHTRVLFSNEVFEDAERHIGAYDYLYNGGGVAIGDLNNDGLPDLFFTGSSVPNKLYFNKGDLKFEDVTAAAGISGEHWSTGVSMADVNNDGWLDIYVCNSGPPWNRSDRRNKLYINQGNGTFIDEAGKRGVDNNGFSVQSSFFDYDRDGDLDLFVMTHISIFRPEKHLIFKQLEGMSPANFAKQCNALYRNNGDGTFEDISAEAGVQKPGYGLGLAISDLNKDGWLDIYVANDFFIPDFYFVNTGQGTFKEQVKSRTEHISYYSMGCDAADFNNDGWVDLGVVDMSPGDHKRSKVLMASMDVNTFAALTNELKYQRQYMINVLQINRGKGFFSEAGGMFNVAKTDWSWGALFVDLDNDGWKDYFVTNGYKRDTKDNDYRAMLSQLVREGGGQLEQGQYFELLQNVDQVPIPNFIFKNHGGIEFKDVSRSWGMTERTFSNGSAYADLDADGDMDLVINNIGEKAHIYRNLAIEKGIGNYLQVTLTSANPAAVQHAKVTISGSKGEQFQEYSTVRGYQSGMEPLMHFGLGDEKVVNKLRVDWLDGSSTILENLKVNQRISVDKDRETVAPVEPAIVNPPFRDVSAQLLKGPFRHIENDFDDFAKEILIPHRQSTLGPCLAVGDVNGDQLEDFLLVGPPANRANYICKPLTQPLVQPHHSHGKCTD